ncbi:MAG: hypothetical protein L0211_05825 [Planctomycetaceae bacterium]|nr:hypothetical protein [Planctomycetaceae bacterium]
MVQGKIYVTENERGGWRVGKLDVSLDSVVIAYRQGFSAETIQQLYPALTLEEVYGAIAFYLANQAAVSKYLEGQEVHWQELHQRIHERPSPVAARLREVAEASRTAR